MQQRTSHPTLLAIIVISIASMAVTTAASARTLQQVLNHGVLRVGIALYAPWAMRADDGTLRGFEVDVAKTLAADMGVKARITVYDWKKLIPALQSGEIDLIASGMTITPDRALQVNFSRPYESGGIALATSIDKTRKARTLADLNTSHYRFAAVEGSVAARLVQRILPRATLMTFKTTDAAKKALLNGEADGLLAPEPIPKFLALSHPDKIDLPLGKALLETRSAFAVGKGDPDFVFFLNAWIIAKQTDTWLPGTHHYWFDTLRWRHDNDQYGNSN